MAQPSPSFTRYLLKFLIASVILLSTHITASSLDFTNKKRQNVILLHLTASNTSKTDPSNLNPFISRRLKTAALPTARMPLYDDLLANGYYTTRLFIGTPPQEFALIVDTGSTVTYVPCSTCEQCGNHQDPRFQPSLSSTYHPVACNPSCPCDEAGKQCTYERRYAEKSSSSGVISEDVVSFGNESVLAPQIATFGCENIETGDLYSQKADGIMGLGRGKLSIIDQLVEKQVIADSFSLCYGGMDIGGGAMVLGSIEYPDEMIFTRSNPYRSPYYNIELKEVHVAGKPLQLSTRAFDGKHGTVLDSGTTYAYLPEEAFSVFKNTIIKELSDLKVIPGPDPNYNDLCFSGAGRDVVQLQKMFPVVDFVFDNGQKYSLTYENYLFRHTKVSGAYCLGIFQNSGDSTTLLGGIVVRNTLVTYDRANERIGFWKTNCSELWRSLNISSPPTPSLPKTIVESSTVSTSAPPPEFPLNDIQIGDITFEMLINVNKSLTKYNFTEMGERIADELGLKDLTVYPMSFDSDDDKYRVRWRISPTGSTRYISNSTAMDIILRLQQHKMKLPDNVGSYQLLEWKIDQKNETWFQLHYLQVVVCVGALVTVIALYVSLFLALKRRRQALAYKPVEGAVGEQELQPLAEDT